ncbi:MAG: cysteine--tRNA ligase [Sphingomonas sanxanigenens]|uniref:Cysteine--tRNA ligase n=1 Tax=Sphingomonas sanxanigenens TaxID=397260 RepID=A0A2W5C9M9_9SPHN|nr:MAG: cysteine--tRNA ligase [Sphingomonas sanxanigenens]
MTTGAHLQLFNSFTRSIESFQPIEPGKVRLYSCGPTVYHFAHLGNLRAYVFTDTLSRVLSWKGYQVTHVINITDVGHLTSDADAGDDKMEAAAKRDNKSIWDIAAFYTEAFKRDIARLNIRQPARWSVATEHVGDMIAFAERIEDKHCYRLDSGLYFDVTTVPDYGRLAGTRPDDREGRIAEVEGKRHPSDFAIWRTSAPDEHRQMEWPSPWGPGAPGWHLECSVMSLKYLGPQFDIHTGGIDHREIHHVNEIAQNQAYTCTSATGANWWMHNNFVVDRGGKMSKSKGGFATLQSLVDRGVHPLAYRLLCLSAHYRSELEFSVETMTAALTRLKRLVMAVEKLRDQAAGKQADALPPAAEALLERFDAAISADLMIPQALPLLDEAIAAKPIAPEARLALVLRMDEVFGLDLATITRAALRVRPLDALVDEADVEARLAERKAARAAKDFAASDRIRDELTAAGIEIMDGDPLGWEWRVTLD